MENAILMIVLAAILGGAIVYIVRAKKRGVKCIGCPSGGSCGQNCGSCSGCHSSEGCGGEEEQRGCHCHVESKQK